jgi:hypothetical protein
MERNRQKLGLLVGEERYLEEGTHAENLLEDGW